MAPGRQRRRHQQADPHHPGEHSAIRAYLVSERICDAKRQLRRQVKHQGGTRPFGHQLGELIAPGQSRALIPDPAGQQAIANIVTMRARGASLMLIRDARCRRGHKISHQTVANICERHALLGAA